MLYNNGHGNHAYYIHSDIDMVYRHEVFPTPIHSHRELMLRADAVRALVNMCHMVLALNAHVVAMTRVYTSYTGIDRMARASLECASTLQYQSIPSSKGQRLRVRPNV